MNKSPTLPFGLGREPVSLLLNQPLIPRGKEISVERSEGIFTSN